jgi:hypothetical protein
MVAQNLISGSSESSLASESILSAVPYQLSLPNHFDETVLLSLKFSCKMLGLSFPYYSQNLLISSRVLSVACMPE